MTEYFAYSGNMRPATVDAGSAQKPASLTTIIGRIEEAVDAETAGLKVRQFDVQASNARKSRYLYELTRALKGIGEAEFAAEHREGILRLREKLSRNEAAIRAHMNAVSEVAALMQEAIRNSEADGTYSAGAFGYGT
jgi:hypothetical protein